VGPGQTEEFDVEGASPDISYRLVGGLTGGGEIVSETFTVRPGSRVRWILPFNTLTVSP
jgi:hypothetical protein